MIDFLQEKDLKKVLFWRNHKDIRHFMMNEKIIKSADHYQWFKNRVQDRSTYALIYSEGGIQSGVITFTKLKKNIYEWGFYTDPNAPKGTGMRMGQEALNFIFNSGKASQIVGRVLDFNPRSKEFHLKLGFKEDSVDINQYERDNKKFNIYNYVLKKENWSTIV